MAYDEALAEKIRTALGRRPGLTEKAMFGGLAFLHQGKMLVGIVKDELMVRVGKERHEEALARPHARTMDFTGRPMIGYVFVAPPGVADIKNVAFWAEWGLKTVQNLGAEERKATQKRPAGRK